MSDGFLCTKWFCILFGCLKSRLTILEDFEKATGKDVQPIMQLLIEPIAMMGARTGETN